MSNGRIMSGGYFACMGNAGNGIWREGCEFKFDWSILL